MRSSPLMRRLGVLAAILVGLGMSRSGFAADDPDFEVTDGAGIYYGNGDHPKAPAVILADDVWAEIPEYKQIVEEELTDDDPEYHLLLKKATRRFTEALRKAATRDGYDMIGEVGAIKANGKNKIPNITDDLVDFVTRG